MIRGLSEYEKYKVIRPIIGDCDYDHYGMPVLRKTDISCLDWEKLKVIGIQNASVKTSDSNTIVLMFNYDKRLMRLWNDP